MIFGELYFLRIKNEGILEAGDRTKKISYFVNFSKNFTDKNINIDIPVMTSAISANKFEN